MFTPELMNDLSQVATKYKNIWVAYSGGVDSHVLLDLARKCIPNVKAIHVNHNVNAVDALWQQHCEQICATLQIPLYCLQVDGRPQSGQSPEAAARIARRQAWQSVLGVEDLLLVAHHADDQAETILYRLLRGAGPDGLSGIKQYSKIGKAVLLRPLLNFNKQQILEYAQKNNLNWISDHTNQDDAMDRNYLRNQIFPLLKKRWPAAATNINRAGAICEQMMDFIGPIINDKMRSMLTEDQALNLLQFKVQTQLWQQRILRAWLQLHGLTVSVKQLQLLQRQVIAARIDANPELIISNKIIKRSKNKLYILDQINNVNADYATSWDLKENLLLPNGEYLTPAEVSSKPEFLSQLLQQQVIVRQGGHGRKAKKIFQQYGIPPWERNKYPLIFVNNRLVSIVGLWSSNRFP